MKRRYKPKPSWQRKAALERIEHLFEQADKRFGEDPTLAHKYVKQARTMAMKFKIPMPRLLRRKFCRHCYKYFKKGVNLRVRTRPGHVVYTCLECKKYMRYVYNKPQKA